MSDDNNNTDEPDWDEDKAQEMAQELIHLQESSSGNSSKKKEHREQLLEWMIENEREKIDVGTGTAEIHFASQAIKPNDLLVTALCDEPYNWTEEKVQDLIQLMADTKERIADVKPVLKIKLKRKTKSVIKKRKHADNVTEEKQLMKELGVSNPYQDDPNVANFLINDQKDEKESVKRPKKDDVTTTISNLGKTPLPSYSQEMDVQDITNGRTRPDYKFVDALGPIRHNSL